MTTQIKKYCLWKGNELWEIVRDNPDKPCYWKYLSLNIFLYNKKKKF